MARKPKVFTWSDGFRVYTVAVTSRAKALQAWGSGHDLFKDGAAREIHDGPDFGTALKVPGEVIARGLAVDVGKVERRAKPRATSKPAEPKGPSKAALAAVARLEARQARQKAEQAEALDRLTTRISALEEERSALRSRQLFERKTLDSELRRARAALQD